MGQLKKSITMISATVIFIAIVFAINLFQYSRLKDDLMTAIVSKASDVELQELRSYFQGIEKSLQLIKAWGEIDAFAKNTASLNKQLLSLLDYKNGIEGISIANDSGQEYYLTSTEQGYLTRYTEVHGGKSEIKYNLWSNNHELLESRENTDAYDPRNRPWYVTSSTKGEVSWTKAYTFHESNVEGITASISWPKKDNSNSYVVFGMDITLDGLQRVFSKLESYGPGIPFVVGNNGKYLRTRMGDDALSAEQIDRLISKAITQWEADDRPLRKLFKGKGEGQTWFVSYQKIDQAGGASWLGVLLPGNVLDDLFRDSMYGVSPWEIVIAFLGVMGLVLLLRHTQFLSSEEEIVPEALFLNCCNEGEGDRVEFKSTIRTNLKSGKHGKEIELAWLKAITAFLNSAGGTLLLGVNDDGTIYGLDADGFENSDKCLLHIKNLLNHHIGAEFSNNISVQALDVENKPVAMVQCSAAGTPVFLRIGKSEEFYIRSGPSSVKLSPSQIVDFVKKNKL